MSGTTISYNDAYGGARAGNHVRSPACAGGDVCSWRRASISAAPAPPSRTPRSPIMPPTAVPGGAGGTGRPGRRRGQRPGRGFFVHRYSNLETMTDDIIDGNQVKGGAGGGGNGLDSSGGAGGAGQGGGLFTTIFGYLCHDRRHHRRGSGRRRDRRPRDRRPRGPTGRMARVSAEASTCPAPARPMQARRSPATPPPRAIIISMAHSVLELVDAVPRGLLPPRLTRDELIRQWWTWDRRQWHPWSSVIPGWLTWRVNSGVTRGRGLLARIPGFPGAGGWKWIFCRQRIVADDHSRRHPGQGEDRDQSYQGCREGKDDPVPVVSSRESLPATACPAAIVLPATHRSSSRANAAAEWYRRPGSFSRHLRQIASSSRSTQGLYERRGTGYAPGPAPGSRIRSRPGTAAGR